MFTMLNNPNSMALFVLTHAGGKSDTYKQHSPSFNNFGHVCSLGSGGFCALTQKSIAPCKARTPGETGHAEGLPDLRARTVPEPLR